MKLNQETKLFVVINNMGLAYYLHVKSNGMSYAPVAVFNGNFKIF